MSSFPGKGLNSPEGTLFKVNKDGTGYQVLTNFTSGFFEFGGFYSSKLTEGVNGRVYVSSRRLGLLSLNKDGTAMVQLMEVPVSPAIVHSDDGWIYGVATNGMFKIGPDGNNLSYITKTNSEERINSYYGITEGTDDWFYGGTGLGTGNTGIFKVMRDGSGYEVLYDFSQLGVDGFARDLIEGTDGWLYGTLTPGINSESGILFKAARDGSGFISLHRFTGWPERWASFEESRTYDSDGAMPSPGLVEGDGGYLYGTTRFGGIYGGGTVFKIHLSGTDYQVVRHFSGSPNDGAQPEGSLTRGSDGRWYGTTSSGGGQNHGMVFSISSDGSGFNIVKKFFAYGVTGGSPLGNLIQARDGYLYGTTSRGGSNDFGTVYRLNPDGSGHIVLKSFAYSREDGGVPLAGVTEGADGSLYGTTSLGGSNWIGTIYKLNKTGTGYRVIHHFAGGLNDGAKPSAMLAKASDGFMYGVTRLGGTHGLGVVYRINGSGRYEVVTSLASNSGYNFTLGLTEAPDGHLYGIEPYYNCCGEMFRVSKTGDYEQALRFPIIVNDFVSANGPWEAVNVGTNGLLYGAASRVYSYNPFTKETRVLTNSIDITGSLTVANDGAFYGLKYNFGAFAFNAFKGYDDGITFTILHSFDLPSFPQFYTKLLITRSGDLFGTFGYLGEYGAGMGYKLYAGPFSPIRLESAENVTTGTKLRFSGSPGEEFKVQGTDDLVKPIWHPVGVGVIGENGFVEVVDEQAGDYEARFYRASRL